MQVGYKLLSSVLLSTGNAACDIILV